MYRPSGFTSSSMISKNKAINATETGVIRISPV
jgi:hypothetical protein